MFILPILNISCQDHNPAESAIYNAYIVYILMDITPLCLASHLISQVDNLIEFMGQFVDLKFRPER